MYFLEFDAKGADIDQVHFFFDFESKYPPSKWCTLEKVSQQEKSLKNTLILEKKYEVVNCEAMKVTLELLVR